MPLELLVPLMPAPPPLGVPAVLLGVDVVVEDDEPVEDEVVVVVVVVVDVVEGGQK
jgi:hypothetical protein